MQQMIPGLNHVLIGIEDEGNGGKMIGDVVVVIPVTRF